MSRTKKGAKGPGYEYWGKRRGSGLPHGRSGKDIYHGQERADAKRELLKEPRTPVYSSEEYVGCDPEGECDCAPDEILEEIGEGEDGQKS